MGKSRLTVDPEYERLPQEGAPEGEKLQERSLIRSFIPSSIGSLAEKAERVSFKTWLVVILTICVILRVAIYFMPAPSIGPVSPGSMEKPVAHKHVPCDEESMYPFDGPREFLVDPAQFHTTSISVEGRVMHGFTTIRLAPDPTATHLNITLNISINDDSLRNHVYISQSDSTKDYALKVSVPQSLRPDYCVQVNMVIEVPTELMELRELVVNMPNSEIRVEDMSRVQFKTFIAFTMSGDAIVQNLKSEKIDVSSVNGRVEGSFITGGDLQLASTNGEIAAEVYPVAGNDVHLSAESVNGDVHMNVPDAAYEGYFSMKTALGQATVGVANGKERLHFDVNKPWMKSGYKKGPGVTRSEIQMQTTNGDVDLTFI
ncbi:uncharacterized protein VTP21DRAFT_11111 [Calcarisporiella thermophila]|uniref:uncharacterized protein n=1 Tax=Calcarisporiella thermophila TaxID=911321 RepID=UPI0037429424